MSEPNGNGDHSHGDAGEAIRLAEQAKEDARLAQRRTSTIELCLVGVAALAAVAAMSFSAWNSYRTREFGRIIADCTNPGGKCFEQAKESNARFRQALVEQIDRVGECQTLQLLQHRDANEKAHALNAHEHGYLYVAPVGEAPLPIPEQLLAACDRFLPKK